MSSIISSNMSDDMTGAFGLNDDKRNSRSAVRVDEQLKAGTGAAFNGLGDTGLGLGANRHVESLQNRRSAGH